MAGNDTGVMTHFRGVKKMQRQEKGKIIVEDGASSLPTPSFSNDFVSAFSFKREDDMEQQSMKYTLARGRETRSCTKAMLNLSKTNTRQDRIKVKMEDNEQLDIESGRERKRSKVGESTDYKFVNDEPEHLPEVPDYIKEDVDILIVGSNPGRMSSQKRQHFSHPSNHFYRALHQSNLTPVRISPDQDFTLLEQSHPYFSIGLTNLVARPTRMAQELNKTEEALGAEILIDLIRRYRPKVGIFVGIGVARSFEKSLSQLILTSKKDCQVKAEEGRNDISVPVSKEIPLVSDKQLGLGVGLMNVGIRHTSGNSHTLLYSMPSTSGRVTTHQLKEKAACMAWARLLTSQLDMDATDCIDDSRHDVLVRLI